MAIHITDSKLEGVLKWMLREPWLGHFHEAINDHFHAYFDKHDTDNFDQLDEMIGRHWVTQLHLIAINDILSRETEDGNVTDIYLKKRGWKERAVPKAYLRGIRNSVMSLYEARDVRPGESFMARDLFLDREPFRVEERDATKKMVPGQHMAMRIINFRGHWIMANGMLPFEPNLSKVAIKQVHWLAGQAEAGLRKMSSSERSNDPAPEAFRDMALTMTLKVYSHLICDIWLNRTMQDPATMTEGVCA